MFIQNPYDEDRDEPDAHIVAALRICLEQFQNPYAVQFRPITSHLQPLKMAYMDIAPDTESDGKTIVLFYGQEFGGYYFHNVIEALTGPGYRVVAPEQIGWGTSPKPDVSNINRRLCGGSSNSSASNHCAAGPGQSYVAGWRNQPV